MSPNQSDSPPQRQPVAVIPATRLLDWYRHQKQSYDEERNSFNAYIEVPGGARDPKINELAGRLAGKQEVLSSFADMLVQEAGVEKPS